jgi:hypothetical protein
MVLSGEGHLRRWSNEASVSGSTRLSVCGWGLHDAPILVMFSQMKATLAKPEIVVRDGKPVSVILRLQDYQELLERAEDAEDTAWLKKAREKATHYRPLEEYLAERKAKRCV